MGCNCLSAAPMLFHESHRSSELGAVPPKTPCIIFSMMLHPKPSQNNRFFSTLCLQRIIQSWRIPILVPSIILDYATPSSHGDSPCELIFLYSSALIHHPSHFWHHPSISESAGLNNFLRCDKRPGKRSFNGKGETEIRNQACLSAVALA